MGNVSIFHWLIILIGAIVVIYPSTRILRRAGFSPWWGVLMVVPLLNLVLMWVFAFAKWPKIQTG
jgi:hypothetical protein